MITLGSLLSIASLGAPTLVPFIQVEREEPITQQKLLAFGVVQDGHSLSVSCFEGGEKFRIAVAPHRYRGNPWGQYPLAPRITSRFAGEEDPRSDQWRYDNTYIRFSGGRPYHKSIASFLYQLERDARFSIRYNSSRRRTETITFDYSIDRTAFRSFLQGCAPSRVLRYLQEWDAEQEGSQK